MPGKHRRLTNQQIDTLIGLTQRQITLLEERLTTLGYTQDDFTAMDTMVDTSPLDIGDEIALPGGTYRVTEYTDHGTVMLDRTR